ncbi:hypothetical protein SVAN01_06672 [Stagonosporopsis vannaccii]|nr:hypothetical protein SVAN01_06672 [Stagonosporopsis vannaccii]
MRPHVARPSNSLSRLCVYVAGEANIDSPVSRCEREETRPTAVERAERAQGRGEKGPRRALDRAMAFAGTAVAYGMALARLKRGKPGHGAGVLGCIRLFRHACRWWLGSAAPKHSVWSLCTAIAAHHVAGGRVLDSRSHSFWPWSVSSIRCSTAASPVKAINKERIGQAGANCRPAPAYPHCRHCCLHRHRALPAHLHLATHSCSIPYVRISPRDCCTLLSDSESTAQALNLDAAPQHAHSKAQHAHSKAQHAHCNAAKAAFVRKQHQGSIPWDTANTHRRCRSCGLSGCATLSAALSGLTPATPTARRSLQTSSHSNQTSAQRNAPAPDSGKGLLTSTCPAPAQAPPPPAACTPATLCAGVESALRIQLRCPPLLRNPRGPSCAVAAAAAAAAATHRAARVFTRGPAVYTLPPIATASSCGGLDLVPLALAPVRVSSAAAPTSTHRQPPRQAQPNAGARLLQS